MFTIISIEFKNELLGINSKDDHINGSINMSNNSAFPKKSSTASPKLGTKKTMPSKRSSSKKKLKKPEIDSTPLLEK